MAFGPRLPAAQCKLMHVLFRFWLGRQENEERQAFFPQPVIERKEETRWLQYRNSIDMDDALVETLGPRCRFILGRPQRVFAFQQGTVAL